MSAGSTAVAQPDDDRETRQESAEFGRVFADAVREAREESRRLGIPNVQVDEQGRLTEELPDGTVRPIRSK